VGGRLSREAHVLGARCPGRRLSGGGMAYGSQPAYASVTRWWQKLTIKLLTIIIVLVLLSSLTVQLKAEAYLNESTLQLCYLCIITHFHKIHSCIFLSCCKTLKHVYINIFLERQKWTSESVAKKRAHKNSGGNLHLLYYGRCEDLDCRLHLKDTKDKRKWKWKWNSSLIQSLVIYSLMNLGDMTVSCCGANNSLV